MFRWLIQRFINKSSYPQAVRISGNVAMTANDKKVIDTYAKKLTNILENNIAMTSKELLNVLDAYNDELNDLTFQTWPTIAVDVRMALRWFTMIDGTKTANQMLFSKLSKENNRKISSILSATNNTVVDLPDTEYTVL